MSTRCAITPFTDLDAATVYALARLRQDVFVVEQECPYPDLDGRDVEPATQHALLLATGEGAFEAGALLGCARILDDGADRRIGRIALARVARGQGLADVLMRAALAWCEQADAVDPDRGPRDVVLDAQAPLLTWYSTHGFAADGREFLEDGIPHVPMRLRRQGR